MQGHDKDRLIVSAVFGTVLYVILFLFLNPLDWLERQRFIEPLGPLVVEIDMLPVSEEDPVVRDDPKEPEPVEEVEPEPVEPEPDLQPAQRAPDPVPTQTASTPAPTWRLAPNLDDTVSDNTGSSLRADRGEPVAPVSDAGTERVTVPNPGDQTGTSGVEYDPNFIRPRDDEETTESTAEKPELSIDTGRIDRALSDTPSTEPRETVREESRETPQQTEFESLEDLTQNREPRGPLARPVIPESVKTGGRTRYEVIVSFLLTEDGFIRNISFEKPPENQELAANIIAALRRWTFIPANESVTVRLRYVIEVK